MTNQRWPTAATFLDRHKARRHFRHCLWSRRDHTGGYQPPEANESALPCTEDCQRQSQRAFALHIAETFCLAFYLWHTPTLVDFNHLADLARHRELIPGPTRASLFSRRHRLSVDVGKQPLAAAFREYVPAARRVAVSGRRESAHFPLRTYKLRVSLHEKLSRFGTVSSQSNEQALTGLSWLSYSPPGFPGRRSLSSLRDRVSPHGQSPRSQRCTVRPWRNQAPSTGFAPALPTTALCDPLSHKVFQSRPRSDWASVVSASDRTVRLLWTEIASRQRKQQ